MNVQMHEFYEHSLGCNNTLQVCRNSVPSLSGVHVYSSRYSVTGMLESNGDALKFWNQKKTTIRDLHYTCDTVYSCIATYTSKALEQRFSMFIE